jgi:hypothetical protein
MSDELRVGMMVRSFTPDTVYRVSSIDRKRLTLTNVDTGKKARLSVDFFIHSLSSGRFVPANGLDYAIESCKQRRTN